MYMLFFDSNSIGETILLFGPRLYILQSTLPSQTSSISGAFLRDSHIDISILRRFVYYFTF